MGKLLITANLIWELFGNILGLRINAGLPDDCRPHLIGGLAPVPRRMSSKNDKSAPEDIRRGSFDI